MRVLAGLALAALVWFVAVGPLLHELLASAEFSVRLHLCCANHMDDDDLELIHTRGYDVRGYWRTDGSLLIRGGCATNCRQGSTTPRTPSHS